MMKVSCFVSLFTAALLGAAPALAQDKYPSRVVSLIVPYPPGGATDVLARVMAEKLTTLLGETVIVDNKPGAGGNLGDRKSVV